MDNVRPLIEEAIRMYGSEAKLAAAVHCSQNSIWAAKRAGRVSAEMAVRIEQATKHAVPRWKLRPDLWQAPDADDFSNIGQVEPPTTAPHGHLSRSDRGGKRDH